MAGEDPGYLAWLRAGPCALAGKDRCNGPVEAHHSTHERRGMSQKAHDHRAFPLCLWHHRTFHDASGYFRTWKKAERQAWQDRMADFYYGRYTADAF